MYKQQKKITVKVTLMQLLCKTELGYKQLQQEYIGAHLTIKQAKELVREMYGTDYLLESVKYEATVIPLDIEKIYKEYKESKEHE